MQSYLFQNYLDSLNRNIFLINQNIQNGGSKKITYNPYVQLIGGRPTDTQTAVPLLFRQGLILILSSVLCETLA